MIQEDFTEADWQIIDQCYSLLEEQGLVDVILYDRIGAPIPKKR